METRLQKVTSIVLNNFKNDSRVLKENISLQRAGYDVTVVAMYEEPLEEFEKVQGIHVHRVKIKSRSLSKHPMVQFFKYLELLYRVVKAYKMSDILHCNDLNALPIGVVIKKFFNKKAKIVYDAHEYETETNGLGGLKQKVVRLIEKRLIKDADAVMTVSNLIAEEYVRLYGIKKPALVLNTPVYKMVEKKNLFREEFNIKKEQKIFLYQGALNSGRGLETLLEAFKALKSNAVIVFMGYGVLAPLIAQSAKESENIYFHEAVSPEVVLDYTSSADFGISTIEDSCLSYRYCLPNKMFEYMMVGIPLLVSPLPEMKKVVEEYNVGVVLEENSVDGVKKSVEEAMTLDVKTLENNLEVAKTIYNWQEQEKVLLKVYNEL
jgi:glycosyltransferase involved in cell wall biosynthesis